MRVALIGNPNCGKTSLFNKLTGYNQKIGNWPGVTIEKKEGRISKTDIEVIDLPGVYSLFPFTNEERVSRDYLIEEKPDLVVNVIDSTALERSLYLTTQLFDLGIKIILAFNMTDLLDKKGIVFNEEILAKELGVPAIKISAKTGFGIDSLLSEITKQKMQNNSNKPKIYAKFVESELKTLEKSLETNNRFLIIEKLNDANLSEKNSVISRSRYVLEKIYNTDITQIFANEKYEFISRLRDKCLKVSNRKQTLSEKLDKVFLNKVLAIPLFVIIMSLVYVLSVGVVGGATTDLINNVVGKFSKLVTKFLNNLGASSWAVSLVVDGVIAGVGAVLGFVPELIVIFLCISLLECSGYMSRISLMFDRIFRGFGLSGKSLVPFIVGTGCSVPAISLTKTIENSKEREKTVMLSPFVPCSAKLPIISLFAGYFFPNNTGLVTASFYFLAVVVILFSSIILNKIFYKKQESSFLLELPEYKIPSVKYVAKDVFDKTKDFVSRAGTIIVFCSVVVWFLSSFNWRFEYGQNINESILAWIGNLFAWFFYPIVGEWNWAVSVSAIQGIIAKEQVVSSMSVIAGISEFGTSGSVFASEIFAGFTKLSAYAFVVFNLFSAPCVASIGAMRNELKGTKKTILALALQIGVAWVLSSAIFLIGSMF